MRCPLLDWDLLAFVRSLPPETLFLAGMPKGLLKGQLSDWPRWFVTRQKRGFNFHLRWAWMLRRFKGLRDRIDPEALEHFRHQMPESLRRPPNSWRTTEIMQEFGSAWKLLVWSAFLRRFRSSCVVQIGAAGSVEFGSGVAKVADRYA